MNHARGFIMAAHQYTFTAVYEKSGDWWAAWVEELPGANTQGRTLEEARENLRDAVLMILEDEDSNSIERAADARDTFREQLVITR